MARERESNRKGSRARLDIALIGPVEEFTATDEQWSKFEKALDKPIPQPVRERIRERTSTYMSGAQAEMKAAFAGDYKKRLAEIEELTTRLRTLLFHGSENLDTLAAATALAGLDELIPQAHEGEDIYEGEDILAAALNAPYVETKRAALENALGRVALNCHMEIHHRDAPGFVEHEAWDVWIAALGKIMREAQLPYGIATSAYERTSPFVRFVDALQGLLPEPLRRHCGPPLTKEMMAARKRIQNRLEDDSKG